MSKYSMAEQETLLHFDPNDKSWIIDTNYAPHIKRLLKHPEALEVLSQDRDEDGKVHHIYARINTVDWLINPWPRKRRVLSDDEKQELQAKLRKNLGRG